MPSPPTSAAPYSMCVNERGTQFRCPKGRELALSLTCSVCSTELPVVIGVIYLASVSQCMSEGGMLTRPPTLPSRSQNVLFSLPGAPPPPAPAAVAESAVIVFLSLSSPDPSWVTFSPGLSSQSRTDSCAVWCRFPAPEDAA